MKQHEIEELKKKILTEVEMYYNLCHQKKEYIEGDHISYSGRVYDANEMISLVDSSLDFWLTSGKYTNTFEKKLAEFLEVKHAFFVNSGSSANLLAIMALTSPLLGDRALGRGDEIITVAAGFPTTVAPIFQYGAVPVFVDITIPQYNIDVDQLESALSEKTKAVMLAHTLGNPFNISKVKDFCVQNDLWLIEDNCDALGSQYKYGDDFQYTGTFGDIGTSSFYPPHHMTTGEGGAVYTNDDLLSKIILSMRDWGRDCTCPSGLDNTCGHRFDRQYGKLPLGYDHKYVYSHFGYNLKATDLQAAIGVPQLEKLPEFVKRRKENFKYLKEKLLEYSLDKYLILPEAEEDSDPSWFGFLMTCKNSVDRNGLVQYLEGKNIQTRMLFAGNITLHPCFDNIRDNPDHYRTMGSLENTNTVLEDAFWIGVYPGLTKPMMDYVVKSMHEGIKEQCNRKSKQANV